MNWSAAPLEVLSVAQMREADARAIAAGTASVELMESAGRAVADAAADMLAHRPGAGARRVAVVAGPGANGGDGFVAARLLAQRGFLVEIGLMGARDRLKGDAAAAAQAWSGLCLPADLLPIEDADLVIDGLFGAGLDRDVTGLARDLVERIARARACGAQVLSVDVPSGLDGDTGRPRGIAVAADATVTFARLKPGHLLLPGRRLCGRTILADIGIGDEIIASLGSKVFLNAPALWRADLPAPRAEGHKYTRGHALVVSGEMHRTGAARLAARAALRGGAGLVTIASPRDALAVNAAHLTAIMLAPCDGPAELAALLSARRFEALVLGPAGGIGEDMRMRVRAALAPGRSTAIVLDADALTSFEGDAASLAQLAQAASAPLVLTPHDGEFSRLFKGMGFKAKADNEVPHTSIELALAGLSAPSRLDRARAAALLSGATIVLKGADCVVAHPDGRAAISADLPPSLATAGSGDVLTGLVAAHLAQGAPAFEAAAAAVWIHGAAARAFGPGLIAEDLPEQFPRVLSSLSESRR